MEEMEKKKYPTCSLIRIISPGEYYVVSTDKKHVLEVLEFEEIMKKGLIYDKTSKIGIKSYVAVKDLEGNLRRGEVEKKITENSYQVLLMDLGLIMRFDKSQMKVIISEFVLKVQPLAFLVKLYGLIPLRPISVGSIRKIRISKDWLSEAKEFVEELFKDRCSVVVQKVIIKQNIVYGDLYVKEEPEMKFVSLRKILCKNGFCVYSENDFLIQEGLSHPPEGVLIKRRMQWVKKWQKENFGIEKSSYHSPTPITTSDTNLSDITSPGISASSSISETSKEKFQTPEKVSEVGLGRGKLKLLIRKMKKKKESSLSAEETDSLEISESSFENESRLPLGRGQLLKKYLERMKSPKPESDSFRTTETDPRQLSPGLLSNSEITSGSDSRTNSKLEGAVIKPGEFSEFSDSIELTEASLATSDKPPPLVRNIKTEKVVKELEDLQNKSEERTKWVEESQTKSKKDEKELESRPDPTLPEVQDRLMKQTINWKDWSREKVWEFTPDKTYLNNLNPFVVFEDSVVDPVKTFTELSIQPKIIKNLERGGTFDRLSPLQSWAIPTIRKQHNTIVIGSAKTGKTLSYVIPLVDYVQDDFYFEELPKGNGPVVVIVASSSTVCESIYYLCLSLLGLYTESDIMKSQIKVEMAHGGGREKEVWTCVSNGCSILISTPHCLVRLLEQPLLTNFQRLMCLVLDEVDIISQNPFRRKVRVILEQAEFATKNRHYQKIFCGERWTANVENLVKTYVKSFALIFDRNRKPEILFEKLKELKMSKIAIACEVSSEASFVSNFLNKRGIPALLAHEDMLACQVKEIRKKWKALNEAVLVFTDGILNELNIRDAKILLHYGLPNQSKTNFYFRYLTLDSFLRKKQSLKEKEINSLVQDIILIDDENHFQLPHIVDFVTRLKGKLPGKILDKCQEIRRTIEINKRNDPLCENLLSFGRCRNSKNCPRRHAFVKSIDSNDGSLPTSGWIKFIVLQTYNASWFSARLPEHFETEILLKVSKYYRKKQNRKPLALPKIGDVVGVKEKIDGVDIFNRAKIVELWKVDKKTTNVIVKLMDRGGMLKRKSIELFELPPELSNQPPTAVDVRLVGVQPMDFDSSWSQIANEFSQTILTEALEENQYWSGKVILALNGCLFLDSVKRKQFLDHLNMDVFDLSFRNELLNNNIAVANNDHLPMLTKFCAEADIDVPKEEDVKEEDVAVVQPQWAFFDSNFVRVKFLSAESTSTIFLQSQKYEKQLADLEEDCTKEAVNAVKELKNRKLKKSQTITVGMFCLALFEDGKWNRGRIDSEDEGGFLVFFVDHGDFLRLPKLNVVPISETLLFRLPCQAIECRLTGTENKKECPLEVLKEIYSFSYDGTADLYANIIRKDPKAEVTGGRKYSLNLLNERGVSINKMLVDRELVCPEESEREYLKDIEMGIWEGEDKAEEAVDEEKEEETEKDYGEVGGIETEDGYIINITDDMFEDEVGQEFLKEFASKVLCCEEPSAGKVNAPSTPQPSEPLKDKILQEKPVQDVKRLLELLKKRRRKKNEKLGLKGREKAFTPQVLWSQSHSEVRMKIMLSDVKDYSFECTAQNVSFRCFFADKFYAVDLKLFGAINIRLTSVILKTFHVLVILRKLAFPTWPRLPLDEAKHRWISYDPDSLTEKTDGFSELVKTAKSEIESGFLKEGKRDSLICSYSDSDDSFEDVLESEKTDSENEI